MSSFQHLIFPSLLTARGEVLPVCTPQGLGQEEEQKQPSWCRGRGGPKERTGGEDEREEQEGTRKGEEKVGDPPPVPLRGRARHTHTLCTVRSLCPGTGEADSQVNPKGSGSQLGLETSYHVFSASPPHPPAPLRVAQPRNGCSAVSAASQGPRPPFPAPPPFFSGCAAPRVCTPWPQAQGSQSAPRLPDPGRTPPGAPPPSAADPQVIPSPFLPPQLQPLPISAVSDPLCWERAPPPAPSPTRLPRGEPRSQAWPPHSQSPPPLSVACHSRTALAFLKPTSPSRCFGFSLGLGT